MNHKRPISLTMCCILAVITGFSVRSFAGDVSETSARAERHLEKANELGCHILFKPISVEEIDELIEKIQKTILPDRTLMDLSYIVN